MKQEWLIGVRATKYLLLWGVPFFAIPLFAVRAIPELAANPILAGRLIWTVGITTLLGAILCVFKAVAKHRESFATVPATGRPTGSPSRLVAGELWTELKRAGDIGGRALVATLLWTVAYWLVINFAFTLAGHSHLEVSEIKDQYIDPALVVGPLIGLLAWWVDVVWREADEGAERAPDSYNGLFAGPRRSFSRVFMLLVIPAAAFALSLLLVR